MNRAIYLNEDISLKAKGLLAVYDYLTEQGLTNSFKEICLFCLESKDEVESIYDELVSWGIILDE